MKVARSAISFHLSFNVSGSEGGGSWGFAGLGDCDERTGDIDLVTGAGGFTDGIGPLPSGLGIPGFVCGADTLSPEGVTESPEMDEMDEMGEMPEAPVVGSGDAKAGDDGAVGLGAGGWACCW